MSNEKLELGYVTSRLRARRRNEEQEAVIKAAVEKTTSGSRSALPTFSEEVIKQHAEERRLWRGAQ